MKESSDIESILTLQTALYKKFVDNIDTFSVEELETLASYQFKARDLFNKMDPIKDEAFNVLKECEKSMNKILEK